jgi:hypothetical protein
MFWVVIICIALLAAAVTGGLVMGRRVRVWDIQSAKGEVPISGQMRRAGSLLLVLAAIIGVLWLVTGNFNWALLRDAGYIYVFVIVTIVSGAAIKRKQGSCGKRYSE